MVYRLVSIVDEICSCSCMADPVLVIRIHSGYQIQENDDNARMESPLSHRFPAPYQRSPFSKRRQCTRCSAVRRGLGTGHVNIDYGSRYGSSQSPAIHAHFRSASLGCVARSLRCAVEAVDIRDFYKPMAPVPSMGIVSSPARRFALESGMPRRRFDSTMPSCDSYIFPLHSRPSHFPFPRPYNQQS